eukprot:TRINITY_DN7671_c0_g1_i1.p1 TRINITY_DN7671_c0_g1~~TRINITY_DN7671_c0_g1_i1.p1  ORF type:complete len:454 (-),score=52.17 TRINITY_DN7671_c0_g1_i1:63-1424(-)
MGASCVRDCERTSYEYAADDSSATRSIGLPGLSHGGLGELRGPGACAEVGGSNSEEPAIVSDSDGTLIVPPMPNWFRAVKHQGRERAYATPRFDEAVKHQGRERAYATPRFDEVPASPHCTPVGGATLVESARRGGSVVQAVQSPTPRAASIPSDSRVPAETPRESSPRAPEEQLGGAKNDEVSYEGTYLGNMKHGTGRLRTSGYTYDGHFENDEKHGNGVLTWDDGRQYRGRFDRGRFHGSAVMTWPDGRKYCGQYHDDRKHGDGTFSWQDGRRYQGQWVIGKRHGVGVYTNAKGVTRTGMWQMDRPLHWNVPGSDLLLTARTEISEGIPEANSPTTSPRAKMAKSSAPSPSPRAKAVHGFTSSSRVCVPVTDDGKVFNQKRLSSELLNSTDDPKLVLPVTALSGDNHVPTTTTCPAEPSSWPHAPKVCPKESTGELAESPPSRTEGHRRKL